MPTLPYRLKVWAFSFNWDDERVLAEKYCTNILAAYAELKSNATFLAILGQVLAIGNVLNGGTLKGQADGFDLPVFTKLTSMKDKDGKTLLQYIMSKLKAKDDDFDTKLKDLISKTVFKDCDNEYIKNKARELTQMVGNARGAFAKVQSDSDSDKYVSQSIDNDDFQTLMGEYLEKTDKQLAIIVADTAKVLETHAQICDFYGIDSKDEMRDKSENFFKLFAEFLKLCEKSLPAPDRKKKK